MYDEDIEVVADKFSIERWQKAAEVVSRIYEEYTKLSWCKGISSHTIGLLTMLDLAYKGLCDKPNIHTIDYETEKLDL